MIETFRQSGYSRERVEFLLRNHGRLARGEPLAPREDRLGNQRCRQEDASWANTATVKADIESGVNSLPFDLKAILITVVMLGGNTYAARQRAAYHFGLTPGQVNDMINTAISLVYENLNSPPPLPIH